MKFILFFVLIILCATNTTAQDEFSFSLGRINLGEKRLDIDLRKLRPIKKLSNQNVSVKILKSSVSWVREKGNILAPRALVSLNIKSPNSISLKYEKQIIIPQGELLKNSFVYVDLYAPKEIEIYEDEKLIEKISFSLDLSSSNKNGHIIDYSCARFQIEISGLDDEYLSLGCTTERLGELGNEKNRIILSLKINNHFINPHDKQNIYAILMNNKSTSFKVKNSNNEEKSVSIKASFPNRAHRLHLAMGLGPYTFNTKVDETVYKYDTSFAAMLYGRWDLSESSSLRIFEALVYRTSLFSNTGLYFAYDLAQLFDNKIRITPLLGAQILTFRIDKNADITNNVIYPQGFEASFNHAFGIKNFNFTYGMFLSTQTQETYKNLWLRWGKGLFWELNYIKWGHENLGAEMFGISIGFPIGKLF